MQQKTKSCVRKMKTMISRLGPNKQLPSMKELATKLKCSYPTTNKIIKTLVVEGYVTNQESIGLFTTVRDMTTWIALHKHYLRRAHSNIEVAKLLNNGGKLLGRYAVLFGKIITAIDVISGEKITTSRDEIEEAIHNPLALEIIVTEKGKKQRICMNKFIRQAEIHTLAEIIHRHQ